MKQIKAYIHHIRTSAVVQALADAGYRNLALLEVKGTLKPLSDDERYYSSEGAGLLIGETRLELVCEDADVDAVTGIIRKHGRIGSQVSGWVYVSEIGQALPIGGGP
jgi:nitrogen regulatory protein P-II 1